MKATDLLYLISGAVKNLGDPRILGVSVDGSGDDGEIVVEVVGEEGDPVTILLRPELLAEEDLDD